ncbi:glycosyltransferase family 2 protein [Salipaludibacillus sp. HK11]|uniref:glycosyltransferase family 2 protein n=1 Tax=Salipaludibacillus sp. HK11 TaxID=3394320 RepID=UPI0039FC1DCA
MKKITIFTPTYNRGYCLKKCYKSLVSQTNQGFVWLIIDDGSIDGTKELVEGWMEEEKIEIHYQYQQNQGMHAAHNAAYSRIVTELNVCLDSDDIFHEKAVERILNFWGKYGSNSVSGIVALNEDLENQVIGTVLPDHITKSTLYDLYYKLDVTGDKKLVYRTELTKQYPYPVFEGEKYVGLAYKYFKLDENFKLLLLNQVLCIVDYLPDGSSNNMLNQYKKNPKGFAFYRKELMMLPFANLSFKFRQAIHLVSSSLMDRNKKLLKETPNKLLTFAALPFGALLYIYINAK